MKIIIIIYIFLSITLSNILFAQFNGNNFSITTNLNFNTTAKIFLTPDAEHVLDRTFNFPIEDIYSYSIEIRYRISEFLILGLSAEYMEASARGRTLTSSPFVVREGFILFPIEFSAYYFLPFSTEDFKFYMGAGIGIYTGSRTREFGDIKFIDVSNEIGYGIQVSVGMDYMIFNNLSIHGELRFRDPDFRITNKYNSEIVTYNDQTFGVSQDEIASKLNVDGITFGLGLAFHF